MPNHRMGVCVRCVPKASRVAISVWCKFRGGAIKHQWARKSVSTTYDCNRPQSVRGAIWWIPLPCRVPQMSSSPPNLGLALDGWTVAPTFPRKRLNRYANAAQHRCVCKSFCSRRGNNVVLSDESKAALTHATDYATRNRGPCEVTPILQWLDVIWHKPTTTVWDRTWISLCACATSRFLSPVFLCSAPAFKNVCLGSLEWCQGG